MDTYAYPGPDGFDSRGSRDAVQTRHADINDDRVRLQATCLGDRLFAIGCVIYDVDGRLRA